MSKTTFAEEVYLRALTGKVVGSDVLASYNKVAVVSQKNIICSAISAAAEATFVDRSGGRAAHFVVEKGNTDAVVEDILRFDPDAVLLMFGGETPMDETMTLFLETLRGLQGAQYFKDIIFHVRIFAAGGLDEALKEEKLVQYLKQTECYVYTVDFDGGAVLLNQIEITGKGSKHLHKVAEFPVTMEHADLLNRSLRDKTVQWIELD